MRLRPALSLRLQILLLLGAGLLPAAFVVGHAAWEERARTPALLLDEISAALRPALTEIRSGLMRDRHLLQMLAEIDSIRSLESARCAQTLADVLRRFPDYLSLSVVDDLGDVRCSARTSEVRRGTNAPTLRIETPVTFDAGRTGILAGTPFLAGFDGLVAAIGAAELDAALIDAEGRVVAAVGGTDLPEGRLPMLPVRAAAPDGDIDWVRERGGDGVPRWYAAAGLPSVDVRLLLGKAEATLRGEADRRFLEALGVPVAIACLSVLLVWWGIDRAVNRWIRILTDALFGAAWSGGAVRPPVPRLRSRLSMLSTAIAFAAHRMRMHDARLRRAANRHEHVVRQSSRWSASALRLAAYRLWPDSGRAGIEDSRSRLQILELVHELAALAPDPFTIDLRLLLQQICIRLLGDSGTEPDDPRVSRIDHGVHVPGIPVEAGEAAILALIVAEALINVRRHAFPGGRSGQVAITLVSDAGHGRLCLTIADNGIGLGNALDIGADAVPRATGIRMMEAMAQRIGADLRIRTEAGTIVDLWLAPEMLRTDDARTQDA